MLSRLCDMHFQLLIILQEPVSSGKVCLTNHFHYWQMNSCQKRRKGESENIHVAVLTGIASALSVKSENRIPSAAG